MKTIAMIGFVLMSLTAHAQGISPLNYECGPKKCSGSYVISNAGLKPLQFTIEAASVHWKEVGQRPAQTLLDPTVTVKLSESSGRLGPKEQRDIGFTIQSSTPATVQLLTGFITGHTASGIAVRAIIPFSVYICLASAKDCRRNTLIAEGFLSKK